MNAHTNTAVILPAIVSRVRSESGSMLYTMFFFLFGIIATPLLPTFE